MNGDEGKRGPSFGRGFFPEFGNDEVPPWEQRYKFGPPNVLDREPYNQKLRGAVANWEDAMRQEEEVDRIVATDYAPEWQDSRCKDLHDALNESHQRFNASTPRHLAARYRQFAGTMGIDSHAAYLAAKAYLAEQSRPERGVPDVVYPKRRGVWERIKNAFLNENPL